MPFTYEDAVVALIRSRCAEPESGGRMVDAILTGTLLPADQPRDPAAAAGAPALTRVHVGVAEGRLAYDFD